MASSLTGNMTINHVDDNIASVSNEDFSQSSVVPTGKRKRDDGIRMKVLSGGHQAISMDDDSRNDDEEDPNFIERYEKNRIKRERLSHIANIFRLVIIFILAPILYFTV